MKIFLLPEQLLAMLKEELYDLEWEGEFLVFRSSTEMSAKLCNAMENAIIDSRPKVVE
jgi:hypothetical protein